MKPSMLSFACLKEVHEALRLTSQHYANFIFKEPISRRSSLEAVFFNDIKEKERQLSVKHAWVSFHWLFSLPLTKTEANILKNLFDKSFDYSIYLSIHSFLNLSIEVKDCLLNQ